KCSAGASLPTGPSFPQVCSSCAHRVRICTRTQEKKRPACKKSFLCVNLTHDEHIRPRSHPAPVSPDGPLAHAKAHPPHRRQLPGRSLPPWLLRRSIGIIPVVLCLPRTPPAD